MHGEILRYRRPEDRLARIAARLLVRRLLAALGVGADLSAWRRTASGRPSLHGVPADISLSHSGDWVAAAIGRGTRLGLDIERRRPLDPADFRSYLTAPEQERIARSGDGIGELLRCWCLREAVLKADGAGLLAGDEAIRAIGEGRHPGGRAWWVQVEEEGPGFMALAADAPPRQVDRRWIPFDELLDTGRLVEPCAEAVLP